MSTHNGPSRSHRELRLEKGVVHVWVLRSDTLPPCVESMSRILSADELAKVEGFRFDADRKRFVFVRGMLRVLLGRYLNSEPGRLSFRYGTFGKPMLEESCNADTIEFNVSHTKGLALYAVAHGRRVGVDLEHFRPSPHLEDVVQYFLSDREQAEWRSLPPERRRLALFKGWTRKEACSKATGRGLAVKPSQVEVSVATNKPAELVCLDGILEKAEYWSLRDLTVPQGYVASLALEGKEPCQTLTRWLW